MTHYSEAWCKERISATRFQFVDDNIFFLCNVRLILKPWPSSCKMHPNKMYLASGVEDRQGVASEVSFLWKETLVLGISGIPQWTPCALVGSPRVEKSKKLVSRASHINWNLKDREISGISWSEKLNYDHLCKEKMLLSIYRVSGWLP